MAFKLRYFLLLLWCSLFSSQKTFSQCAIPSSLSTTQITSTGAKLNWATSGTVDSFLVRYYEAGTANYIFKLVASSTATNTTISGLRPGTTYYWQVRTSCMGGTSGAYQATPSSFTTLSQNVACVTPNLTITANVSSSGASLSWNTYVTADSFMIRYAVRGTTNYNYLKIVGSLHSYNLTGLLSSTSYEWAVRCICASTPIQTYSTSLVFTTLASSCGTPNAAYFTNSNRTSNSATVGWRSVSGAVSYNVRYAVRYSGAWTTITSTTTSKSLTGLLALTTYEFQVQTVCSSGVSGWSTSGIFTTLTTSLSITRGPYLQQANTTSIYVRWRTNTASNSTVRFGTASTNLNFSATDAASTTEHIVQLTNLTPSTKYYYSIGTSTATIAGDTGYYFLTHPTVGSTGAVRIWAIGDFGLNSTAQKQVRDAYVNYSSTTNTNLWLWLGDNAYVNGLDSEYQSNVFDVYPYQFRKWVCWPSTGNHDLYSANAAAQTGAYFDAFTLPKNGEVGGMASGTEAYYSYNYANIHFICLESNDAPFRAVNGAQATWLAADLAANTQRWTIVYFHHPPYSKGSHNSDSSVELVEMRTNIAPILEQYKVDLVLSGHSHAYERSYLIRGHFGLESTFNLSTMAVNSGSGIYPSSYTKSSPNFYGTVYTVCGVSGQLSSTTTGWPHNAMYTSTNTVYGSLVLDIAGDRLDCKFLTNTGSTWDQFTIQKIGVTPAQSPSMASSLSNLLYPASPIFDLALFPNPVNDDASIQFNLDKAAQVRIKAYDVNGKNIFNEGTEMQLPEGPQQMRLPFSPATLPNGIYVLSVEADGFITTRRFIVQH